jgi:hypothetical protein
LTTYQLPVWVWPTALMVVCGIAVWRGRDEERLAAAVVLADWALSMMVFKPRSQETQWGVLLVDCGQFGLFLWLALRTSRHWPLAVAGFALLQLVTAVAHAIDATVSGWAYLTANIIWSYLILFTIGYAAWTAPRYAMKAAEPTAGPPGAPPGAMRR